MKGAPAFPDLVEENNEASAGSMTEAEDKACEV